ncbi:MAG: cupredoxin domain-containing protein [Conexivisphaerales archaeon]
MPSERSSRAALAFLGGLLLTAAITIATGINLIAASLGVLGSLVLSVRELVTTERGEGKAEARSYTKWVWFTAAVALVTLTAIPILAAYSPTALSQPNAPGAVGGSASSSQVTCANPCVIEIKNSVFGTGDQVKNGNGYVVVAAGTQVIWENEDTTQHTTTSVNGVWDSGIMNPGQSFSFTFSKPGVYNYICNVHPMSGTIVVVG